MSLDEQGLESIFGAALQRSPDERAAFLVAACGENAALRARVARLLQCFERGAASLENPPPSLLVYEDSSTDETRPGQRIGPYELTRNLASGGMGTVWLARRADEQFEKQVALKLIKRGMDTDALLARFRRERQVLASLEHPSIARLLDGGMTSDGLPYLVMEYVDGVPIDRYCDERRLTISQRLELFRTMCAAVQFAHQNLIVHRDLKPSNILVTSDGAPKLVDFGIAKVLSPDQTQAPASETAPEFRIMTPRYASPEQVRGERITTASDVYSLGVVLYELLTGHEPYELTTRSRSEYERAICEQEPARPSTAVSRAARIDASSPSSRMVTPEAVSAARREDPQKLKRRLTGDLDMIVMTALRKEPDRRYHTVEQLSEDIRRHLENLPITVRPDSWRYAARKTIARNARLVAAATMVAVSLVAGTVASTTLYLRSEANRRRAEDAARRAELARQAADDQVRKTEAMKHLAESETYKGTLTNEFLGSILGQWLNACRSPNPLLTVRASLDEITRDLKEGKRSYEPDVEAVVRLTLADAYRTVGPESSAESHYLKSIELRRKAFGDHDLRVADAMERLGRMYRVVPRLEDAERMIVGALEIRRAISGPDDGYLAVAHNNLGMLRRAQRKYDLALDAYRESLRVYRVIPESDSIPIVLANIGAVYLEMGCAAEAEAAFAESIQIGRRMHGEVHAEVAQTQSMLGVALHMQRHAEQEAESCLRTAVRNLERLLGAKDARVAIAESRLAEYLQEMGRASEAEPFIWETLDALRSTGLNAATAQAQSRIGAILRREGRLDEAEAVYVDIIRRAGSSPSNGPIVVESVYGLARICESRGRSSEVLRPAVEH